MRIVVKIGTNTLTKKNGELDNEQITSFAKDTAKLVKVGHQVLIVTSGAIGAGMGKLGFKNRPSSLQEKQALAAVGQPLLMDIYQDAFSKLGLTIAQVLLTRHDFDDRKKYINARNTLNSLLKLGVIPIINENDTVAVEEINFGDNDTLSALVASGVSADWLFILTDVEGLYKGVPGKSELIHTVDAITPEIEKYASGVSGSGKGVGGMKTKISAANIATKTGVKTVIANGTEEMIIQKILDGEKRGTIFLPSKKLEARKHWIAFGPKCKGKIIIDEGAAKALLKGGKSLLPSGVIGTEGTFSAGDTVSIIGHDKKEVARGMVNYSKDFIEKIKGKKSAEIQKMFSEAIFDEVIHRDNLVILD
ncbi:MAG: glutamate 5-kinase [Elusimicrobia bacterium]|nr:glutamate 5-kinase [Elusimicrobiota bacterium]